MTAPDWIFDVVLASTLPVLAWRVLASRDLSKAVVLFIAFGLVCALAWARLEAPDIALVEAAIGAGLTGALLMNSLGWIRARPHLSAAVSRPRRVLLGVLAAGLASGLAVAIVQLPTSPGLGPTVLARAPESGAAHPVTAVLLDFRGYDTLLEIAVLVAAAIGVRAYASRSPATEDPVRPLLDVLVRVLAPTSILVAGYLIWTGTIAPGGAFQAAAVLAGLGIVLVLARATRPPGVRSRRVRGVLVGGLAAFVAIAALPLVLGDPLLAYPPAAAKLLVFAIELALTISIGLALVLFFPGMPPMRRSEAGAPHEVRT